MTVRFGFLQNGLLFGFCWYELEETAVFEIDLLFMVVVFEKRIVRVTSRVISRVIKEN